MALRICALTIVTATLAFWLPPAIAQQQFQIEGSVVALSSNAKSVVAGAEITLLYKRQTAGDTTADDSGDFRIQIDGANEQFFTGRVLVKQGRRYTPMVSHTFTVDAGQTMQLTQMTLQEFDASPAADAGVRFAAAEARRWDPLSRTTRELEAWVEDLNRKTAGPAELKILVPAYFYPNGPGLKEWTTLIQSAKGKVTLYAVVNPSNGSGATANADYAKIIQKAKTAGIRLIGYISTRYGERPIEEVEAEVKRWFDLYPDISGIFIDEFSADEQYVEYYASLKQSLLGTSPKAEIFANPGTNVTESSVTQGLADTFFLFENRAAVLPELQLPGWLKDYPPDRFGVLIYDEANTEAMTKHLEWAQKTGIAWVYITDRHQNGGVLNPWTALPTYWRQLTTGVTKLNGELRTSGTPGKASK